MCASRHGTKHVIGSQLGIGKVVIPFVCLLASPMYPLEKHMVLTHTNMEAQQSKVVVIQSLLLSSSTFQLLDLLLTDQ
jgi:hypothetical protein